MLFLSLNWLIGVRSSLIFTNSMFWLVGVESFRYAFDDRSSFFNPIDLEAWLLPKSRDVLSILSYLCLGLVERLSFGFFLVVPNEGGMPKVILCSGDPYSPSKLDLSEFFLFYNACFFISTANVYGLSGDLSKILLTSLRKSNSSATLSIYFSWMLKLKDYR